MATGCNKCGSPFDLSFQQLPIVFDPCSHGCCNFCFAEVKKNKVCHICSSNLNKSDVDYRYFSALRNSSQTMKQSVAAVVRKDSTSKIAPLEIDSSSVKKNSKKQERYRRYDCFPCC